MARSHGEVMGQNLKNLKSRKTSRNPLFSCCCATSGGILDRAVEAEDKKHGDILRLDHFSSRSVPFFRYDDPRRGFSSCSFDSCSEISLRLSCCPTTVTGLWKLWLLSFLEKLGGVYGT
ncbi:uncharacterized protein LOC133797816 [Humulus lupulus]|uniref:uncharacterized protein LOC133797816 n=1 Tax=Humulus lupulus TaxID=3486 RepID=UPI002B40A304|nr:uncharacterized protein LOC133797816 [Humulus lupulus]